LLGIYILFYNIELSQDSIAPRTLADLAGLIDLLAQQVNGTVTTCSVPGEGTHVELLFKDPSPAGAVAN